jgi:hypothetical protein
VAVRQVKILPLLLGLSVAHAAGIWVTEFGGSGSDAELCYALNNRLNAMNNGSVCAHDAIESYPKFSEPPWRRLDPKQHFELIVRLLKYSQVGARAYFDGSAGITDSGYTSRATDFIKRGGEIKVWRTRLVPSFNAGTRIAPPGLQTIVLMIDKGVGTAVPSDQCPGKASRGWVRESFIVLPDLSGPDPQVDSGTGALLSSTWPVIYAGIPLLINTYNVDHLDVSSCRYRLIDSKRRKSAPAHKEN